MNDIMKTAARRSDSWCWGKLHAADKCSKTRHVPFLCVKTQTSVLKEHYYSYPGHSNKEEVDKAWHAVSKEVNIDGKCTD
jgi:hypothetical protein